MRNARVIAIAVLAAVGYGIVHDQITARISLDYFTLAHPPLFPTTSPTLLALCWGVASTAWLGAAFGFVLAMVANSAGVAPMPTLQLVRSLLMLLGVTAVAAVIAGVLGYELAQHSLVSIAPELRTLRPRAEYDRFVAVWFAHLASYAAGMCGGAFLIFGIWRDRGKPNVLPFVPASRADLLRVGILVAIAVVVIAWRVL